jgi:hypothetical protein
MDNLVQFLRSFCFDNILYDIQKVCGMQTFLYFAKAESLQAL